MHNYTFSSCPLVENILLLISNNSGKCYQVGGAQEAYLAAEPLFLSMGRSSIYCGGAGNGSVGSLVLFSLFATNLFLSGLVALACIWKLLLQYYFLRDDTKYVESCLHQSSMCLVTSYVLIDN